MSLSRVTTAGQVCDTHAHACTRPHPLTHARIPHLQFIYQGITDAQKYHISCVLGLMSMVPDQTDDGGAEEEATEVTKYTLNPQTPAQQFDAALSKLKPDLVKLARDKASQKKKGTGYRNRLLAEVTEAREAQAVERQVPTVRAGAGDRRSTRCSRTEVVRKR